MHYAVSQTSASLTITPVSIAAATNKGLSNGAKIGIAIVVAVAGFFIIFLAIVFIRRRRQMSLSNRRAENLRRRVAGHSSTLSETMPMIMLSSPEPGREDIRSSTPAYDHGRRGVDIGQYRGIPALSFENQDIPFLSPGEMSTLIHAESSRQPYDKQLAHQEPVFNTSSMFQPLPVVSFSEVVELGREVDPWQRS